MIISYKDRYYETPCTLSFPHNVYIFITQIFIIQQFVLLLVLYARVKHDATIVFVLKSPQSLNKKRLALAPENAGRMD